MKRSIYFCKSWFRAKKRPTEIWSDAQARVAHEKRQHYAVLVDSTDQPNCFLDVADKLVGVGFLDKHLRESLTYAFQEFESGNLFLSMETYREFDGDTDKVVSGTSYVFGRDGTTQIRREFFEPYRVETATSRIDVTSNYSKVPEFGEYDDLIRVDRVNG